MLKISSNMAPDNGIAYPDSPDTIPTILLPESEAKDVSVQLQSYLQTGWQVVGKLSMTEPQNSSVPSSVMDYLVLQPVQDIPPREFTRWHQ